MTPDELAQIHAECFPPHAAWDSRAFQNFLNDPSVLLLSNEAGFILVQKAKPEAEILTLAVRPSARRTGIASNLLDQMIKNLGKNHFESVFLEVSTENPQAIALYEKFDFKPVGRRKGYYRSPNGNRTDALVLSRAIDLSTTKKHP